MQGFQGKKQKPVEKPDQGKKQKPVEKPDPGKKQKPVEKPDQGNKQKPVEKPDQGNKQKPVEKPDPWDARRARNYGNEPWGRNDDPGTKKTEKTEPTTFTDPFSKEYKLKLATLTHTQGRFKITTVKMPISKAGPMNDLTKRLGIPMPEMTFGDNLVAITHEESGWELSFSAEPALHRVAKKGKRGVLKVAHAAKWSRSRERASQTRDIREVVREYDWSYSTVYRGIEVPGRQPVIRRRALSQPDMPSAFVTPGTSITPGTFVTPELTAPPLPLVRPSASATPGPTTTAVTSATPATPSTSAAPQSPTSSSSSATPNTPPTPESQHIRFCLPQVHPKETVPKRPKPFNKMAPSTDHPIPVAMLQRRDPILFFNKVTLYESELDDNGISCLDVKVRVMEECMLLLCRLFMRLDDVLVRVRDTRVYIDFKTDRVIREYTAREDTVENVIKKLKEKIVPEQMQVQGRRLTLSELTHITMRDGNKIADLLPVVITATDTVRLVPAPVPVPEPE